MKWIAFTLLLSFASAHAQDVHRVLNGTPVAENGQSDNFTVRLKIKKKDGSGSSCTGVIVGDDLVLTAGHCIDKSELKITIQFGRGGKNGFTHEVNAVRYTYLNNRPPSNGASRWSDGEMKFNEELQREFLATVQGLRSWRNGGPANNPKKILFDDIGLVKIGRIPRGYSPVRVYGDRLQFKQELIVAGFGTNSRIQSENDDVLRFGRLEVIGHYSSPGEDTRGYEYFSPAGNNACAGDSGAPVLAKNAFGELELVGLHIFSINSCANSGYSLKIDFYRNWIEDAAARLKGKLSL